MTGSAFNAISYFLKKNVQFTSDQPNEYAYVSPVHGRALRPQFCPRCGVTVGLTLERNEAVYGILIGTFDAPDWITVDKHIFVQSALHWDSFPPWTCSQSIPQRLMDSQSHRSVLGFRPTSPADPVVARCLSTTRPAAHVPAGISHTVGIGRTFFNDFVHGDVGIVRRGHDEYQLGILGNTICTSSDATGRCPWSRRRRRSMERSCRCR
jgi:hypothetical protein